jgi:hypothetical protein
MGDISKKVADPLIPPPKKKVQKIIKMTTPDIKCKILEAMGAKFAIALSIYFHR